MNTFSLSKCFTVVLLMLFTTHVWAVQADNDCNSDESQKKFKEKCVIELTVKKSDGKDTDPDSSDLNKCVDRKTTSCTSGNDRTVSACKASMKEWRDKASKGTRACLAFDKSMGQTCQQKINGCQNKISGLTDPSDGSPDASLGFLKQIIQSQYSVSDAAATAAATGDVACVKQYDAKTKKEDEKDFAKEKKDLEKEIKKETDEQTKLTKELREKNDKIKKEITDLENEMKKTLAKTPIKLREETERQQKASIDTAKRLRTMNDTILAAQQKLTKLRFANQTALLDLTDDKITNRCKQQLMNLKSGLLNPSSAGDPKASADLKNLAGQMGKGTAGQANIERLLKQTKDACFQQENVKKQQVMLQYNEDVTNTNRQIANIQDDMAKEKAQVEAEKKSAESAKAEADKADDLTKSEEAEKAANLNAELINFQDSINDQIRNSKTQVAKLTQDIQQLILKKNLEVEPAFDDALDAIDNSEKARTSAMSDCNCPSDLPDSKKKTKDEDGNDVVAKAPSDECVMLIKSSTNYDKSTGRLVPSTVK